MIDRLRVLLDRPLDPSAAQAILVLTSAIFLGLAVLFVPAGSEPDRSISEGHRPAAASSPVPVVPDEEVEYKAADHRSPVHRQDPQDIDGSDAARRAGHALASHRALQHVPHRSDELKIQLVGARGRRAVLHVTAETARAARRGWQRFLRRYRDSGWAYIAIFRGKDGKRDG